MDWDFTENIAFKALYEAFKDSDETSALEFLSSDGASYYLELTQDAAGEGLDLGDNETMEELQEEIIIHYTTYRMIPSIIFVIVAKSISEPACHRGATTNFNFFS